jgi:glucuronate isomerase
MTAKLTMHPDRLFPAEPSLRAVARSLYEGVKDLPIVSPHGHTDPSWYARDISFPNPSQLFLIPDHYLFRMLYSQGVTMESLGIPRADGGISEGNPRKIWRLFADNYHLFRGTPSRMWFDYVLHFIFGVKDRLGPDTADAIYDTIETQLKLPEFKVRKLYERFNIEVLSTTDSPLDSLEHHRAIKDSGWQGRVVPAFRPDPVVDPEFENFADNVARLGELTGEDTASWSGYLKALAQRRQFFKELGCTSTDHGHPTALTADLSAEQCQKLLSGALAGNLSKKEAELFRGQMLTEMVGMSLEDNLVIQIHPGSSRNHNQKVYERFGRDMGGDIPMRTDYVKAMKPMLDRYGNQPGVTVVLFTLDETAYSRELAPLAGHYPILRLGPAWWFYDSAEGMMRYRRMTTESAGFYNTAGFNDDTRAFLSIPARHDVARRIDCTYLAEMVCDHRIDEDEAHLVAADLAYHLARKTYGFV